MRTELKARIREAVELRAEGKSWAQIAEKLSVVHGAEHLSAVPLLIQAKPDLLCILERVDYFDLHSYLLFRIETL